MREFTIDLSKALSKGLSPTETREGLILGLYECFNQVPDEVGLKPWVPISPIGMRLIPTEELPPVNCFNYLPIRDQTGVLWYWYPVFDGHILAGSTIPSEPSTGLIPLSIVAQPVEWVEIFDELGNVWKLYPDVEAGFTRATDSTPLNGIGLQYLIWRGTTTELWTNRFDLESHTRFAQKVAG
jgi:hypothetical protein